MKFLNFVRVPRSLTEPNAPPERGKMSMLILTRCLGSPTRLEVKVPREIRGAFTLIVFEIWTKKEMTS